MENKDEIIDMTADIVSAYVGNNTVATSDLPTLISSVYSALQTAAGGLAAAREEPSKPAVPIKKSVHEDSIICLSCGGSFKSLRRHLGSHHNMTPEEYRAAWNLPVDYPMVAPSYARARSELAKKMGLGKRPSTARTRKRA